MIVLSLGVGSEWAELSVRSPVPLNNDQWHRVEVEKNIRETVLQLNRESREVRATPPLGHTKLEIHSDLYVGETSAPRRSSDTNSFQQSTLSLCPGASRGQRGFLGCIRALRINAVTLDLEERAKTSGGVNPGCLGHCSSYRTLCRNGGRCVEQYNGYSCDCSLTAYDGPFCSDGNHLNRIRSDQVPSQCLTPPLLCS